MCKCATPLVVPPPGALVQALLVRPLVFLPRRLAAVADVVEAHALPFPFHFLFPIPIPIPIPIPLPFSRHSPPPPPSFHSIPFLLPL